MLKNNRNSRFKENVMKMPDIASMNYRSANRYQEPEETSQKQQNSVSNARHIINVNNPHVIIQSPQNNTIIFMDGKSRENSSRNMINDLIKKGLISKGKLQSTRDPGS